MAFSAVAVTVQISAWYKTIGSINVLKCLIFVAMLSFLDLYMCLWAVIVSSARALRRLIFSAESRSVPRSLHFFQLCFAGVVGSSGTSDHINNYEIPV